MQTWKVRLYPRTFMLTVSTAGPLIAVFSSPVDWIIVVGGLILWAMIVRFWFLAPVRVTQLKDGRIETKRGGLSPCIFVPGETRVVEIRRPLPFGEAWSVRLRNLRSGVQARVLITEFRKDARDDLARAIKALSHTATPGK